MLLKQMLLGVHHIGDGQSICTWMVTHVTFMHGLSFG